LICRLGFGLEGRLADESHHPRGLKDQEGSREGGQRGRREGGKEGRREGGKEGGRGLRGGIPGAVGNHGKKGQRATRERDENGREGQRGCFRFVSLVNK
jgi:hypothetical protein